MKFFYLLFLTILFFSCTNYSADYSGSIPKEELFKEGKFSKKVTELISPPIGLPPITEEHLQFFYSKYSKFEIDDNYNLNQQKYRKALSIYRRNIEGSNTDSDGILFLFTPKSTYGNVIFILNWCLIEHCDTYIWRDNTIIIPYDHKNYNFE